MKLFIFKAVGSYFGGMAMATANSEREAFDKIASFSANRDNKEEDRKSYLDCYFKNWYSKEAVLEEDIEEWGWVCIETVNVDKDIVFCEFHDGAEEKWLSNNKAN